MLEKIIANEHDIKLIRKAKKMLSQIKQGNKVCKLNKSLCGLRQVGRQWHTKFDTILKHLGLNPTNADPCVYLDKKKQIILLVYVDDIIIASRKEDSINRLKDELAKRVAIKNLKKANHVSA